MASERVVAEISRTCIACPSQWEGKLKTGEFFYMRFRWGSYEVGIGATEDEAVTNSDRECADIGDSCMDGYLTDLEMMAEASNFGFSFPPDCWKTDLVTSVDLFGN